MFTFTYCAEEHGTNQNCTFLQGWDIYNYTCLHNESKIDLSFFADINFHTQLSDVFYNLYLARRLHLILADLASETPLLPLVWTMKAKHKYVGIMLLLLRSFRHYRMLVCSSFQERLLQVHQARPHLLILGSHKISKRSSTFLG